MCAECAIRTWLHKVIKPYCQQGCQLSLTRATCPMCHTPYPRVHSILILGRLQWALSCAPFIREVQQDQMVSDMLQRLSEAVQELSNAAPRDKDAEELRLKYGGEAGAETAEHLRRRR